MPPWCARSQFHCTTTITSATTTTTAATTKWSDRVPCQYGNCLRDGRVEFSSKLRQMWLLVRTENITRQPTMKSFLFRNVKFETPPGGVWRMIPTEAKAIFTSSYLQLWIWNINNIDRSTEAAKRCSGLTKYLPETTLCNCDSWHWISLSCLQISFLRQKCPPVNTPLVGKSFGQSEHAHLWNHYQFTICRRLPQAVILPHNAGALWIRLKFQTQRHRWQVGAQTFCGKQTSTGRKRAVWEQLQILHKPFLY